MNKLLISGAVAVFGFIGKLIWDEEKAQQKKSKAQEVERKARAEEYERARIEANQKWEAEQKAREDEREARKIEREAEQKRIELERIRLLPKITTSSNNYIKGYKIVRHIRMVSINDEGFKTIAEGKFLLAVEEAGGNGVLNMQVRPHRGGYFSVQGDAVLIEPV